MRSFSLRSTTLPGSPTALAGLFALLMTASACGGNTDGGAGIVTESVRHQEVDNSVVNGDLQVSAIDYVRALSSELELGLSANDDYSVTSVVTTPGLRHARMQQTYAGVPVFGAELVVHADDTTFLGFNGFVTKNLDGFDVTTSVSEDQALAAAQSDLAGGVDGVQFSDETGELVILPREGGKGADLAWHVKFYNSRAEGLEAGLWSYFVDAREGTVLEKFNNLHTVEQASGPGGNAKKARTWNAELDVEPDGGEYKMETERLRTLDRSMNDEVVRGADLDNMEDAVANDVHGYSEITLNMMRDWMGRNSLDDNGFVIVSRVHDTDYCPGAPANACWNGQVMTYGDGGDYLYPLGGALDVVAHELNHGFTTFHSNLIYAGQSGALNESFSDIAGALAEFYDEGDAGDFDVGEDVLMADAAVRYMCQPSADGRSLDSASDYEEGVDVHYSSGVPNRAFCLAVGRFKATSGGGSTVQAIREVGHIWYTANAAYWTSSATYEEGCRGTIDAARALGHDGEVVEALAQSWTDVGVHCDSAAFVCTPDGTCDVGAGETCASCAEDCGACSEDCSFWKKAKCKIGIGDCSACDLPPGCGDGICNGDETDETCAEDCGCQAFACEQLAPFGCYCDPACEEYGDCCADYGTCN